MPSTLQSTDRQTVIPVVAEGLTIAKQIVETGRGVRVTKTVEEREQIADEALGRDELVVERIAINQVIDATDIPGVRYEGQTIIVPVLEEVLVIEKRTMLKEELRITRLRREVHLPQRVVLRTEHVSAEHFDESDLSSGRDGKHD